MRLILSSLVMIASSHCFAAELTANEWKAPNGFQVIYRLAEPAKVEEGKTYPLVLFLHGAGERGNDNVKQLKHGVKALLENAEKLNEPCYLIAPQCPAEEWWAPLDEGKTRLIAATEPNLKTEALLALVAEFSKTHPVDASRFYVTGLSMGGFGTFDILGRAPEKVAAALPVCGGGDTKLVSRYKDVPLWAFHGDKDPTVPLSASESMIEALKAAGGEPKLTVYPGVKHDSWTQTYANPEAIRWLFSHRKKTP